jgi:Carboxypeptidase regulatory-like domain
MFVSRFFLRAFGVAACLSLFVYAAHAQYRASIQGTVTDPQGAAVSAATVTLTNLETNQIQTTTTEANGIYNLSGLAPAHYSITVEKAGFKKKVLQDVGVIAEQANALNIQLEVGEVTQSVVVSSETAPLIDTETSNLSATVTSQEYQALPSFGRDPFQLLQLAPGAFGDGAQAAGGGTQNLPSTTIGGTGGTDGVFKTENGGQIVAGGARNGENNYTIDGVEMTSVSWGGAAVVTPGEDSIKEVKVITDNYDAEYGRYLGAQVQIISQNGTNQYHGSLFFKAHRPGLDAFTKYNGFNSDQPDCSKPCGNVKDDARFNDFGGTVGGPIIHNRLFAFFSYETLRNNQAGITGGGWYETAAFRALAPSGSNAAKYFSYPGIAPTTGTVEAAAAPGDAFSCSQVGLVEGTNCITVPGKGLNLGSPLTAALGTPDAGFQSASVPGTGGDGTGSPSNLNPSVADVAFISGILSPSTSTEAQYNGRIDFNLTSHDLIAFSMYYVPVASTSINSYFSGVRPMNEFNHAVINEALTGVWDHTFSSTVVNEARLNAAGWRWNDLNLNPNGPWGLAPLMVNALGKGSSSTTPSLSLSGFGIGVPGLFDQWTYGLKDVLTKVHNSHTMKMGGEVTRLYFLDDAPWNARPQYNFDNIWDLLNDAPVTELATFNPTSGVPTDFRKDTRSTLDAFFFQDDYKVRSNLTLTLGLRWEYFGPISEIHGHLASVDLGSGADMLSGVHVRLGGDLYNAQKGNFGPQLGFAWSPTSFAGHEFSNKLVFRGGFGIAYNGEDEATSLDGRNNPPFLSSTPTLTNPQNMNCLSGGTAACPIVYASSFPSNVHSFYGYASDPTTIESFDPATNLPIPGPNFAPISLVGYPATWPTTYTYHFNLQGQYDLGQDWVATLGYQGSTTRHLTRQYNLYDVLGAQGFAFNPVVTGIDWNANDGSSRFNALLLELNHHFSQSFQIDAQYRFSRTLDTGSNEYATGIYQFNLQAGNFGPADYDVRNMFKLYGVWAPTIFRGDRSWMEKVAGGWTLSGILNAHSGFPWTPVYSFSGDYPANNSMDPFYSLGPGAGGSSSDSGNGTITPAAYLGGFHPDYRSNVPLTSTNDGSNYFMQPNVVPGALFACLFPNPPVAQCPTGQVSTGPIPAAGISRNLFRGPGYFDVDATLSKAFGLPPMKVLGEGAKIEFRMNFYNLFNKLNLNPASLDTDVMSANFGEVGANGNNGALGSRTIEIQGRFSF